MQAWVTTADEALKLEPHTPLEATTTSVASSDILIDPAVLHQSVHGFGAAITDASAELIADLPKDRRKALMAELFGREGGGLGLSFTRLTLGSSDFSRTHYSFDDPPGGLPDPDLRHFSIRSVRTSVLPVVRQALAINPDLQIMLSAWSAPAWMKTSKSLITGKLDPIYYPAFAEYFARTIEAYRAEGVPVDLLSIQNEPDFEPKDYPGMRMSAADRAIVIGRHLGPLLRARGIKTRILDWDHNWDHPEQPLGVLADPVARPFVSGVAWHCYGGDIGAQEKVRAAHPDKDVWFTECSGGNWAPKFGETLLWMTGKLIIASSNSGSRGTSLWNLALDPAHGPHKGGCGDCRGVVTIDPATGAVTRNVEYYVLAHASRFVRPGALRIGITPPAGIEATAFRNPDRSIAVILLRQAGAPPPIVALGGRRYAIAMPPASVATIVFSPSTQ